jgi:hypothetical protein
VFSNRLLLGGIAVEIALAMTIVYLPALHHSFGTAALSPRQLVVLLPYPLIVWGSDEVRRAAMPWGRATRPATTEPLIDRECEQSSCSGSVGSSAR